MALRFDAGNYINLGTGLNVSGNQMSISAWALIPATISGSDARVISKGIGTAIDEDIWALRISQSAGGRPQFSARVGGSRQITTLAGAALSLGVWHHLVGVFNNGNIQIWTDTVLINSAGADLGNIDTNADETWIGDQPITGTRPMRGNLDDIRVYNGALGEIDIQTLFQTRGGDGIVNNLFYRWPCNDFAPETPATSVTDVIGGQSGVGVIGTGAAIPDFVEGTTKERHRTHHPFPPGL